MCTTILVGKNASLSHSNMVARSDDSGSSGFTARRFVMVLPDDQPKTYESKIGHCRIDLPENPVRYSAVPAANPAVGDWGSAGVNDYGVAMSATQSITTNDRVLAADPLVYYHASTKTPGGISEEDMLTIVLPYIKSAREDIKSAREGVLLLGSYLEKNGTFEKNGIAFSDEDEIWWMETIGGHHWIAKKLPDDMYAVIPNRFSLDVFDLDDACGEQLENLCSKDLKEFVEKNQLNPALDERFSPREIFGSWTSADMIYNAPRTYVIEQAFNPHLFSLEKDNPDSQMESLNLPWALKPERKISIQDLKNLLGSHFEQTPFDPYSDPRFAPMQGKYRPLGVNRTNYLGIIEHRPDDEILFWCSFGCQTFTALVPYYVPVNKTPDYLSGTERSYTHQNSYWTNRLIAALADASFIKCRSMIEYHQSLVSQKAGEIVRDYDERLRNLNLDCPEEDHVSLKEEANEEMASMLAFYETRLLDQVLKQRSFEMKNAFSKKDLQ